MAANGRAQEAAHHEDLGWQRQSSPGVLAIDIAAHQRHGPRLVPSSQRLLERNHKFLWEVAARHSHSGVVHPDVADRQLVTCLHGHERTTTVPENAGAARLGEHRGEIVKLVLRSLRSRQGRLPCWPRRLYRWAL